MWHFEVVDQLLKRLIDKRSQTGYNLLRGPVPEHWGRLGTWNSVTQEFNMFGLALFRKMQRWQILLTGRVFRALHAACLADPLFMLNLILKLLRGFLSKVIQQMGST